MAAPTLLRPRVSALLVLAGAALTIAGALTFQYGLGYVPCKLCLTERVPYYATIPLAAVAAFSPAKLGRALLGLIALLLFYGAGLGIYHAGAEWGFWAGPSDCGGGSGAEPTEVGDFLNQLQGIRVVDCTAAAWRFLGISLAGWNALIAAALGLLAAASALTGAQLRIGPHHPGR